MRPCSAFSAIPPGPGTLTTLQHALTRGLEVVFQLEEGEILTEPTPSRERRRAILAFEATEGGAGVLGRLVAEGDGMARVARAALDLMHLENRDRADCSKMAGSDSSPSRTPPRPCYATGWGHEQRQRRRCSIRRRVDGQRGRMKTRMDLPTAPAFSGLCRSFRSRNRELISPCAFAVPC